MRKAGKADLVKKVLLFEKEVDKETEVALIKAMDELTYLEHTVLRHLANGTTYERVGKILEVPEKYVKYQEKKAIRHLRAPLRYYRIFYGNAKYESIKDKHYGEKLITSCGFTTKTANVLKKNGFYYVEELIKYISGVPERFAYIEGLGKLGMSEVLFYFMERGIKT